MEETKVIEETTEKVETEQTEQAETTETTGAETETKTEEKTEEKQEETTASDAKEQALTKEEILTLIEKEFDLKRKEEAKETTEEIPEGPEAVLSDGLPIMAAGMMGIFVVIGIIIATISLLSKLGDGNGYFSKGVKALFKKN